LAAENGGFESISQLKAAYKSAGEEMQCENQCRENVARREMSSVSRKPAHRGGEIAEEMTLNQWRNENVAVINQPENGILAISSSSIEAKAIKPAKLKHHQAK
jgi:hypothetical protein